MNFGYGVWHQWLAMMVNSGHVWGQDDMVTNGLSCKLMSVWWFISSIDAYVVGVHFALKGLVWFLQHYSHANIIVGLMMKMMIPKSKCNKPTKIVRSNFFNNWYYWESMQEKYKNCPRIRTGSIFSCEIFIRKREKISRLTIPGQHRVFAKAFSDIVKCLLRCYWVLCYT